MINWALKAGEKTYRFLKQHKSFSSDSLANIEYLVDGLSDQKENISDELVINRIISSFHEAKKQQKNVSLPYQPAGAWKGDIKTRRAEYLNALDASDFETLSKLLRNFFRNSGIAGLWTHGYYEDILTANNNRKKCFVNSILSDYRTLVDFVDDFNVANLKVPSIGNPWGYFIKGTLVLPTACRLYYYATHAKNLLEDIEYPVICEIGGGFGGFAYYLLSQEKSIKYINIDLPEVLLIAQYFLMNSFPGKKFLLYGNSGHQNISEEIINSYDIILMPNFSLPNIADKSVDLFINTESLSEMDYHTVEEYINQIARITKKYFFHENSDRPILNSGGHMEVVSSNFQIPHDIFKRIYKSNSLWGGGSGRYREHLYLRKEA